MADAEAVVLPERPKEDAVEPEVKISKKQQKKQEKKQEKKQAKETKPKVVKEQKAPPPKKEAEPDVLIDANAMFKEGFLKSVYSEKPSQHVVTRFPPEPNGFLHIGHSKAIAINFGFARYHGGECYLRYDDTNPEAEEEKYFTAISEMINWLGFKPKAITYSSDNFDKLYELAERLISKDGAYVCHCSDSEVKKQRGEGKDLPRYTCAHRDRPVDESLAEFRAMRDGKYKPREAVLRMKQDMKNNANPQMWDLTAYRILENSHHRTSDKWRIYPTYDFTHCLCDSFEGITHSLCTVEFFQSRESYEWLCDAVDVYKPMQREYGRLNVTGTVLSKRKIQKLVQEKVVRGWDDPRLYTLIALRRRGVPPGAILSFVNELGVSTALTNIQLVRFEQSIRRYLEQTVPRLMLVLDPIPVIIDDLPDDHLEEIAMPFSPYVPTMGSHIVPFTKKVYIDRADFREQDSKDYFRLAPGKSVGLLKVPYPIKATSFSKDPTTGQITEVRASYEKPEPGTTTFKKPKTYIQWIADSPAHGSPIPAEVRIFGQLFRSENPDAAEGGFMADVNPNSEQVFPNAIIETGLTEVRRRAPWPEEAGEKGVSMKEPEDTALLGIEEGKVEGVGEREKKESVARVEPRFETVRFQGLRVAYFCMDEDSREGKVVLNRIVSLKEDSGKLG